ncbi:hypothetical protein [Nocardiopsis gilva]|uniref:hypothetical protein n=1 Tax=Nocardiopsis gilva TaxID=280236 RepID=UPI000346EE7C|nr:hypothetical protein [Nocardiopsis gilva]
MASQRASKPWQRVGAANAPPTIPGRCCPGVIANVLTDPAAIDPLPGTAVLNGFPVDVLPAP